MLAERAVYPLYQPIVDLGTRSLVGVEALARGPAGSPVEYPDVLFAAAERAGLLHLVDQLCFAQAVSVARAAGDVTPPLVFVNAEPGALNHEVTPELLAEISAQRSFRIVMELTERALAAYPASLLHIAALVHHGGGALALDDVGADPLSMAFLPLLEPEVVKLDMHLLRNPHAEYTIETTAMAAAYADRTGTVVLAEGIETEADLATAQTLGARWGQGWLFARPGPLSAVADRPVHHSARLRPPRPDLHQPAGTPFSVAAARHHSRRADQPMIDALIEYMWRQAAGTGPYAVVLGSYPDPATGQAWLSRLASVAQKAAFVGMTGPALPGAIPPPIRIATTRRETAQSSEAAETVLAVVGPYCAVALCIRPHIDDKADFVLTHDPDLVHAVARMLLRQLGTAAERPNPPTGDPHAGPTPAATGPRTQ
ncbi:EAL domain-containing protein [Couchioplanes azureus]|uniref:EAL domain-containing protein n=1 Tax=Couchioplanes caeruleus TaxID=56438 RepID=UPI001E5AC555|nr:EAL domain-containing protein [Couchioplanes caeruleus]